MGMYSICSYKRFSITDIGKFERRLRNWCQEVSDMRGKSMLIFDRDSLIIEVDSQKFKSGDREYYKVTLPNLSFTYTYVADNAMCVMYKIWENKTESVIYNIPKKWDGTELWLAE